MLNKKFKKGFTLMEVLVVVVMLGILASIAVPSYIFNIEMTRAREAIEFFRQWQAARDIYLAESDFSDQSSSNTLDLGNRMQMDNFLTANFKYFQCVLSTNTSYRCDRKNKLYSIFGTDSDIFCCWIETEDDNNANAQKVCSNLSTSNVILRGEALPEDVINDQNGNKLSACYKLDIND